MELFSLRGQGQLCQIMVCSRGDAVAAGEVEWWSEGGERRSVEVINKEWIKREIFFLLKTLYFFVVVKISI